MKNLYNIQDDQAAVSELIGICKKKSILSTLIWSAMMHLKSNPKESLRNAIEIAKQEWEKSQKEK